MTSTEQLLASEAELRQQLESESSPALDKLRAEAPAMRTSHLIVLLTDAKAFTRVLDEDGDLGALDAARVERLVAAGMLAVCDEIDRRFPPRG